MKEQALFLMRMHGVKKGINRTSLFEGRMKRTHGPDPAPGPPFG